LSDLKGLWNWTKCKKTINRLPGRLGFQKLEYIEFLELKLDLHNGDIYDLLSDAIIDDHDIQSKHLIKSIYYLLSGYSKAKKIKITDDLITFKQIRGNRFVNRGKGAKERLIREFSKKPRKLILSAEKLGGNQIDFPYGDVKISLKPLPLIPLTIVLYAGDQEFPGDARIFYDASIKDVFDAEQTNFITHLTISRLITANKQINNKHFS
jgi:hypothetical protein